MLLGCTWTYKQILELFFLCYLAINYKKQKSEEKLQLSESRLVKWSAFCSFSAKYLIQVNCDNFIEESNKKRCKKQLYKITHGMEVY